ARVPPRDAPARRARTDRRRRRHLGARGQRVRRDRDSRVQSEGRERAQLRPLYGVRVVRGTAGGGSARAAFDDSAHGAPRAAHGRRDAVRVISAAGLGARVGAFALDDVAFDVPSGAYGVVIGPTGSGKTTLLEVI